MTPETAPSSPPDWKPTAKCGHGLHGALWGEGDGSLLSWEPDAKWLVVEVDQESLIDLQGKVKFPRGVVVYCGDQLGATTFLTERLPKDRMYFIIGGTATAGDWGTATAGDDGTATAGYGGTVSAGERGCLILHWRDDMRSRTRLVVGYIGENGLLPGVKYRLNDAHEFEETGK